MADNPPAFPLANADDFGTGATGLFLNVSAHDFYTHAGIGARELQQFRRSPAHYLRAMAVTPEPTPSQVLGAAVHSLLFCTHDPVNEHFYVLPPDFNPRTNDGKARRAELGHQYGQHVLTQKEYAEAEALRDAAKATQWFTDRLLRAMGAAPLPMEDALDVEGGAPLPNHGLAGASVVWTEGEGDREYVFKALADLVVPVSRDAQGVITVDVVDVKTARDASPTGFGAAVDEFGYLDEAAFTVRGLEACGYRVGRYSFVVLEKEAPYATAIYTLPELALTAVGGYVTQAINGIRECDATATFPGYGGPFTLPVNYPGYETFT